MSKTLLVNTPLDEVAATLRALDEASGKKLGPEHLAYLRLNPKVVARRVAEALKQQGSDQLIFAQARYLKEGFLPWSGAAQAFVELVRKQVIGKGKEGVSSSNPLLPLCLNDLDSTSRFGDGWSIGDTHSLVWIPNFHLSSLFDLFAREDLISTYGVFGARMIPGYPQPIAVETIRVNLDAVKLGENPAGLQGEGMALRALLGASDTTRSSTWSLIYRDGICSGEHRTKFAAASDYKLMEPAEVVWWFTIESLAGSESSRRFRNLYRCATNERLEAAGVKAVTVSYGREWPVRSVITYWGSERDLDKQMYRWAVARPLEHGNVDDVE